MQLLELLTSWFPITSAYSLSSRLWIALSWINFTPFSTCFTIHSNSRGHSPPRSAMDRTQKSWEELVDTTDMCTIWQHKVEVRFNRNDWSTESFSFLSWTSGSFAPSGRQADLLSTYFFCGIVPEAAVCLGASGLEEDWWVNLRIERTTWITFLPLRKGHGENIKISFSP